MPLSAPFCVLLVDDDELDRMAVRRALVATAPLVTIVEAEDIAGGLRLMALSSVDCVLLDYHLPDGLGLELLLDMRASGRSMPVIMLTGVGDAQTAVELMKAGATDYIPKTLLSPERLERSLRYALGMRAAEARVRRYTDQLHTLSGAALRINATLSTERMLAVCAEEARRLVGAYAATTFIEQVPNRGKLEVVSRADVTTEVAPEASLHAVATHANSDEPLRDSLDAPLLARDGTLLGSVSVQAMQGHTFSETDHAVIVQLAQLASGAIENARLLEKANAATQGRDDMLAIVSHDLRNPVQTIVMASTVLLELAPDESRRQVEIVLRAASRANRLIDDLMDATRIDAGTFSIDALPLRIEPLFREAADLLTPLAAAGNIELVVSLDDDMPLVLADSQRILQVFSNIGGNAIKFTPPGGRVTLAAVSHPGHVLMSVSDTGRGIAGDDLTHIFDRYWQARGRERLGAGLGLWIAKGIVEAHGGHIEVESASNTGTTVRFTVPTH